MPARVETTDTRADVQYRAGMLLSGCGGKTGREGGLSGQGGAAEPRIRDEFVKTS